MNWLQEEKKKKSPSKRRRKRRRGENEKWRKKLVGGEETFCGCRGGWFKGRKRERKKIERACYDFFFHLVYALFSLTPSLSPFPSLLLCPFLPILPSSSHLSQPLPSLTSFFYFISLSSSFSPSSSLSNSPQLSSFLLSPPSSILSSSLSYLSHPLPFFPSSSISFFFLSSPSYLLSLPLSPLLLSPLSSSSSSPF